MSDENEIFDHGNIMSMPETAQETALKMQVKELERTIATKDYQIDLTGAMARLNIAGQIAGSIAAVYYDPNNNNMVEYCHSLADDIVSHYEKLMEERARSFMAVRPMSPSDEKNETEN